jgi:hypothetical protein
MHVRAALITILCAFPLRAASAIAVDVSSDLRATHLFALRIQGHSASSDSKRKEPERFRLVIAGSVVRAELQSDVGLFTAGTVLIASDGSNEVTVLDPAHRTWYETTFGLIDAKQEPGIGQLTKVTSKLIRDEPANAPGGTAHRQVLVELELPNVGSMTPLLTYRVDVWARADPRLEPARHLLNVLTRRDPLALHPRFRDVMSVFPDGFPVAESISPTFSAIGALPQKPTTLPSDRTFVLSDPQEVAVTEADFTVPSTYAKVESPFRVTR